MADQKNAETSEAKSQVDQNDELSAQDLDEVAGGINPQPLPPMPRMAQ